QFIVTCALPQRLAFGACADHQRCDLGLSGFSRHGYLLPPTACAAVGRHLGAALALLALFVHPSPLLQSNPTWRPRMQSRALAGAADPDYLNDQNFQYTF